MALSITSVTSWNQASRSSEAARLTMTSPGRPLFGAEAELHLALRYHRARERDRAAGLQVFIFCVARYRPLAMGDVSRYSLACDIRLMAGFDHHVYVFSYIECSA